MTKRLACVFLVLFAAILVSPSRAGAEADEDKAKKHFKQGVTLYNESNFKAALVEFRTSFKFRPNWKVRYYIGVSHQALHSFVEADEELRAYLEEGGDQVPADNKTKVEDLLDQIAGVIGSLDLTANVDGAAIYIDGEHVGETPLKKPLRVNVGLYKIEVEKTGYESIVKKLDLPGGEVTKLDLVLLKIGGEAEVEVKAEDKGEKEIEAVTRKTEEKKKKKKKPVKTSAFYGMVGATGALLAGTAVVCGLALQKHNEYEGADSNDLDLRKSLADEGKMLNLVSNVMIGVTAASAAATLVLVFFTDFKKKKEKKTANLPVVRFDGLSFSFTQTF
ncbi:MAG: PEGA domain-containing protein [Pseudomonadota bacterium]